VTEGAVEQIERILAEIEDADEVLRGTVAALVEDPSIAWAGIGFLDDGELTRGPQAGRPDETSRTQVTVAYQGAVVGVLEADGDPDRARLERIATLIAPHVLIGWDTGGEAWEP
jgi:hypothetical protein